MTLVCPVCEREFWRKPSCRRPGSCCSRKCLAERKKPVDLVCANKACGVSFSRSPHRVPKDPRNACCSRKCATAHMRDRGMHRLPFRRVEARPAVVEPPPDPIPHCADYEDRPIGA